MQISPIANVAASLNSSAAAGSTGGSKFSDILNNLIGDVKETEVQDQQGTAEMLSGGDYDIHTAMIESQEAELTLNLAIQIRNKVIDAYNEVMRMQI